MEGEVAAICEELRSEDWTIRVAALKRLSKAASGFGDERRGFAQTLKPTHDIVAKLLLDLRSSVAAEACRTVAVAVRAVGGEVHSCSDAWAQPLLTLLAGTGPRVVQSAADAAMRAIVQAAAPRGVASLASRLCETALHAKAPPTRRSALEYLAVAVAAWGSQHVEPHLGAVCAIIGAKARDADDKVRRAARLLWWAVRGAGFAYQAAQVRDDLDVATTKALDRDKPKDLDLARVQTLPPPPNNHPPAAAAAAAAAAAPPSQQAKRHQQAHSPPSGGGGGSGGQHAAAAQRPRPATVTKSYGNKHTAHHRNAPIVVDGEVYFDDETVDDVDRSGAAHPPPPPPPTWAPPGPWTTTDGSGPSVLLFSQEDEAVLAAQCHGIFTEASSPHWDVRSDAVGSLDRVLRMKPQGATASEAWRVVVQAMKDSHHRVALTAVDVVAGALSSADSACLAQRVDRYSVLSTLLASAADRLVDVRPPLRAAAGRVLDAARRACAPSSLLAAIAPRCGDLSPLRARAALLEFASALIRVDGENADRPFLAPGSEAFGDFVARLAGTLRSTLEDAARARNAGAHSKTANDGAPAAFAAAARCAAALRRVDPAAFARAAAATSSDDRVALVDALAELAPDFDHELRAAHGGRALHPSHLTSVNPRPTAEARRNLADYVAALADPKAYDDNPHLETRQRDARLGIAKLAKSKNDDDATWAAYFEQIAMLLLEKACAHHPPSRHGGARQTMSAADANNNNNNTTIALSELAARHESLGALSALAKRRPLLYKSVLDASVPRLLRLAQSAHAVPLELSWAAERVLFAIAEHVDAKQTLDLVMPELERCAEGLDSDADAAALARAPLARVVGKCARHAPSATLRRHIAAMLPPLAACAAAPRAETRKAAVDALVELYIALGDAIVPRLKPLMHDDHLKLVAMYVHRRGANNNTTTTTAPALQTARAR